MKRSGTGCQDFSHPVAQRRSYGARHGVAALLPGQELRLAGPRDSAPSDNQARACRRSTGAPDSGRRLFSICSIQATSAGWGPGHSPQTQVRDAGPHLQDARECGFRRRLVPRLPTTLRTASCGLFYSMETVTLCFHFPHFIWLQRLKDQTAAGQFWALGGAGGCLLPAILYKDHWLPPSDPGSGPAALAAPPATASLASTTLTFPPNFLKLNSSMVPIAWKMYLLLLCRQTQQMRWILKKSDPPFSRLTPPLSHLIAPLST